MTSNLRVSQQQKVLRVTFFDRYQLPKFQIRKPNQDPNQEVISFTPIGKRNGEIVIVAQFPEDLGEYEVYACKPSSLNPDFEKLATVTVLNGQRQVFKAS